MASFLDNIAAAVLGGAMAHSLFGKVHIGYLAGIVAASNAGVAPLNVARAYVAAGAALLICGLPAAFQQQAHAPIVRHIKHRPTIDWVRVGIVLTMLTAAIGANMVVNVRFRAHAESFPFIGVAVWVVILLSAPIRRPDWSLLGEASRGAAFLLSLVLAGSMMPVEQLRAASWPTAFGLGFASAVFDNIPLTKLALDQGGYDWGVLSYCVGFGGSMIWFGSSAGVALANLYPEARSVGAWIRHGWHVPLAYVVGFFVMLSLLGWEPSAPHRAAPATMPSDVAATGPNR